MNEDIYKRNSVILIPALNPPNALLAYVDSLNKNGFKNIIVINDGSEHTYEDIFKQLVEKNKCLLLKHAVNLGKGRALKNGLNLFLNEFSNQEQIKAIIAVDSDGQHKVEDVIKLDDYFSKNHVCNEMVLGVRNFKYSHVPFKSRFGNELTSKLFYLLYGAKLKDTQTGLRGIPKEMAKGFIELDGERFEYEMNQLIKSVRRNSDFKEIEIETIYIDNNSETHFHPIKDSWAIYKLLFGSFVKYSFSSLSSSIIDIGLFQIFFMLFSRGMVNTIWIATILARIISSLYNYLVNKSIVFESTASHKKTIVRYYVLCVMQMLCSAAGVSLLNMLIPDKIVIAKVFVDVILFFISYRIQRKFVFAKGTNE